MSAKTYRRDIIEKLPQKPNDVVHVLVALDESQSFGPCQFSDNVKCEELQPLAEVAAAARIREHLIGLVQPVCEGGVHQRLVVDERAHRKGIIDASAILCVEVFVGSREEGKKWLSLRHCSLNGIEVGLAVPVSRRSTATGLWGTYLIDTLVQTIDGFDCLRVRK